jgi:hypothetical protein
MLSFEEAVRKRTGMYFSVTPDRRRWALAADAALSWW